MVGSCLLAVKWQLHCSHFCLEVMEENLGGIPQLLGKAVLLAHVLGKQRLSITVVMLAL